MTHILDNKAWAAFAERLRQHEVSPMLARHGRIAGLSAAVFSLRGKLAESAPRHIAAISVGRDQIRTFAEIGEDGLASLITGIVPEPEPAEPAGKPKKGGKA